MKFEEMIDFARSIFKNIKINDMTGNDGAIFVGNEFLSVRACQELVHLFLKK